MLGEHLKDLRTSNNLTQKQVSISLNLSEARYGQYEANKRRPDFETLKDISKFYKVSIDYLLDNDTNNINEKEVKQIDALKDMLVKIGFLEKNEVLTSKELESILNFIKCNKDYIKHYNK